MNRPTTDVAFTPAVKSQQEKLGSRRAYSRLEARGGWPDRLSPELVEFIGRVDSFFIATASADGQPYMQHRGGAPGFLRVLDDHTLAFADFRGNRQYITVGNLAENDRAMLFLIDYSTGERYKIWGRARVVEGDAALEGQLAVPGYEGRVERAIFFDVQAWDANCPQHIPLK